MVPGVILKNEFTLRYVDLILKIHYKIHVISKYLVFRLKSLLLTGKSISADLGYSNRD